MAGTDEVAALVVWALLAPGHAGPRRQAPLLWPPSRLTTVSKVA